VSKVVYVSWTSGVDTNPGTQSLPVKTIDKATTLATANAGDTVAIESGVYLPAPYNANEAFAPFKSGTLYQGYGPSMPILDANWRNWGINMSQGSGMTVDKLEWRNAVQILMELNGVKGSASGFKLTNCVMHDVDSKMGAAQTSSQPFCALVKVDWGNPLIQGNVFHHCGEYNETYGIFIDACKNAVIDGNDFYFIRKQAIRDYYSLYTIIKNNFAQSCEGGLDMAGGFGALIANNFVARTDYGIICKHCNNPTFLNSIWGLTQSQLTRWTTIWHNTIYNSMDTHMELGVSLTGSNPDYLEMTEARLNILAGRAYVALYDQPTARTAECYTDYNILPTNAMLGQGVYRRGLVSSSWVVDYDLAAMRADPIIGTSGSQAAWEQHGQQLDPTFVDPVNNNLNPNTDYRSAITPQSIDGISSPWGNQVGARGAVISGKKWQPEKVITITGSAGTAANLAKIVDGYGAITNYVIATLVESQHKTASITCDLGSQKQISGFRWTPWSHNQWDNVKDYKLEGSNTSSTGPWTTVLTDNFTDYGGTSYNIDLPQPTTYRYWKFTALTNFLNGSGQTSLIGGSSDRLVFAEIELGNILTVNVSPPPVPAPANTVAPSISGTKVSGYTLTGSVGTWTDAVSYTYRWFRDATVVSGQTALTYVLTSADVGHTITFEVEAYNATAPSPNGVVATSAPTSAITAPPAPTNSVLPSISGTTAPGDVLTGDVGVWSGGPTFTYRWLRDGVGTAVGTGLTYTIVSGDIGHTLVFEVTASNSTGTLVKSSAPSPAVTAGGTVLTGSVSDYWGMST
jgi:hypothetical protein